MPGLIQQPAPTDDCASAAGQGSDPTHSGLTDLHNLASSKISCSFSQGDASVDDLGTAITAISASVRRLQSESRAMSDHNKVNALIDRYSQTMSDQVNEAITALQFYDLLSQQMEKVRIAVRELGCLLAEPSDPSERQEWLIQLRTLHQRLTDESGGATVTATSEVRQPNSPSVSSGNDLAGNSCELF